MNRETDLFRAPKGRGSVDKNIFLILIKKTLRALVPKARVEAVFQGEKSPTQVREDEAEVWKTIQRAAKHQARNVDRGVKGAAQIAREVELLHAVRMGHGEFGGRVDQNRDIEIGNGFVERVHALVVEENPADMGIDADPFAAQFQNSSSQLPLSIALKRRDMGKRDQTVGILSGDLRHPVVNETRPLEIDPVQPHPDVQGRLVYSSPVHRLDLLLDAGGHPWRREELDPGAPNAKTVRLMNDFFLLAHVKLGPAIVLFRHPMMMDIDDEILLHNLSF